MKKMTIIVPCYNEQAAIPLFYQRLKEILGNYVDEYAGHQWDLLFVDDGSTDDSLTEMERLQVSDPEHVHFLSFSRNFGKEAALYAGLENADAEYVGVMDVDLQDPPELLPQMSAYLDSGDYDTVATKRDSRKGEPIVRSFFSKMFYKLINRISQTPIPEGARDYRLMNRKVVDAVLAMPEVNRFSKGIFNWVGFRTKVLTFDHQERVAGETHWSFKQLVSYSFEGIMDFSDKPLTIASVVGGASFVLSIFSLIFIVIRALAFGDPTAGWPSLVSIILMIGGIQLFCLGIAGKYIAKIYLEVKQRPVYITREQK